MIPDAPDAHGGRFPARADWIVCLFLVAIVWAIYGQTVGFGFVHDDHFYITDNLIVQKGITIEGLKWALVYGEIGHWHPLTWVSHMLDCQLYGNWPGGHHLTNVLAQMATAAGLFLALRKLTGSFWCSAITAAIWTAHPLRVESVAWVSERKDILGSFFFVLVLWAYAGYARQGGRRRYWLTVTLFAAGLLAKGMLVTVPFVLLLLDWWPLRRLPVHGSSPMDFVRHLLRLAAEKAPLFGLSIASCAATLLAPEKIAPEHQIPLLLRAENAVVTYGIYIRQMFWPADLSIVYPNPTSHFPAATLVALLLGLATVTVFCVVLRRSAPYLLTGWFWYLGMLIPVIGLVQISYYAHADRYTNLPQIGILLMCVWGAADGARRFRGGHWLPLAAALALVLAFATAARRQTGHWRNSDLLWGRALACTEGNFVAHNNLALALAQRGKLDQAISHYRQALEIKPDFGEAHNNLGFLLLQEGRPAEASMHFRRALEINPNNAEAHQNLGILLMQQGQVDQAMAEYLTALSIKPGYALAHVNLASALMQAGRFEEAITHCRRALEIDPKNLEAENNLANALLYSGRPGEAATHYGRALELSPGQVIVSNNLAWLLATSGDGSLRDGARAEKLARQSVESTGNSNPRFLATLAAALAEQGRFSEAIAVAERALQLSDLEGNARMSGDLKNHILSYSRSLPIRDLRVATP